MTKRTRRRLVATLIIALPCLLLASLALAATTNVQQADQTATAVVATAIAQATPRMATAIALDAATATPTATAPPVVVESWDITLSTAPNLALSVQMQDFDGFDNAASVVALVHAKGAKAVCYFSAGSAEDWRPDYEQFAAADKGKALQGWAGEYWLDTRSPNVRAIMVARIQMCKAKGFDAIDPDKVDGYDHDTGLALSAADQLDYNTFLARTAHENGLAILLKNDTKQVAQLASLFDGSVVEQCARYNECAAYSPMVAAGHPVFAIEYGSVGCDTLNALNFNGLLKQLALDIYRVPCR